MNGLLQWKGCLQSSSRQFTHLYKFTTQSFVMIRAYNKSLKFVKPDEQLLECGCSAQTNHLWYPILMAH